MNRRIVPKKLLSATGGNFFKLCYVKTRLKRLLILSSRTIIKDHYSKLKQKK